LFVVPKKGFHKKYAHLAVRYGGNDRRFETCGKWVDTPQGVAHFLEHQMFSMEDGDAMTKLSANGASPNAYTSTDVTAYHFGCIDMFFDNLGLLLDFVTTPYFTPEGIAKEKGVITQEIRMCDDDPGYVMYYGLLGALFEHNPVRDSVVGTVESVMGITADILHDCHRAFYSPSNMALCVVGDLDPNQVRDIAQVCFSDSGGTVSRRDYGPPEAMKPYRTRFETEMEVSLPIFLAGCKSAPVPNGRENQRTGFVSSLAVDLLAGCSSPLFLRLYAEGHVNNDFSASFDFDAETAYIAFGGEARDPEYVIAQTCEEIEKLLANGPDAALFKRIKKAAIGNQVSILNSFPALASSIVEGHFMGYDRFDDLKVLEAIDEEDVMAFVRDRIVPGNMAVSIVSPNDRKE
jgi:predicted Zn-dependent peptidase